MSSYIVDRRLNSKNKSTVNRQRFLKRYRKQIRKAVSDAVNERKLEDMESGDNISIPTKDLSEPVFHHGKGGKQNIVHPGNKEFIPVTNSNAQKVDKVVRVMVMRLIRVKVKMSLYSKYRRQNF